MQQFSTKKPIHGLYIFTLDYVIHDFRGITPHDQVNTWGSFFVPDPLNYGIWIERSTI